MADTFDIGTLFPVNTLQRIVQHYGCPSFYDDTPDTAPHDNERIWYVHFFTGRVPTPAEFYYGTYVDRVGDSHVATPLTLAERYLGHFELWTDRDTRYTYPYRKYALMVGIDVLAHGAIWPEGAVFLPRLNNGAYATARVPPNKYADPSWVLDWAFAAGSPVELYQGQQSAIRTLAADGKLVHDGKPTWFYISSNRALPYSYTKYVDYTLGNSNWRAIIETIRDDYEEQRPMIMGTVGALGSGADLELSTGADTTPDEISPVSLRVLVKAPDAPAGV